MTATTSVADAVTRLEDLSATALAAIADAETTPALDEVRVAFLGRRSDLGGIQRMMGQLDPADRPRLGKALNTFKGVVESALDERNAALEAAELRARLATERIDLTVPPRAVPPGRLNLLRQVEHRMVDIFVGLGWQVVDGPEVEAAAYAFDALNIPPDHPARQDMDTIYLADSRVDQYGLPEVVLRPHTSPVQARVMREQDPPIAIVVPGRTYRNDILDATHSPAFHQIEGLVIDRGVTMAHLRGSLLAFVREMFGPERDIRLRPSKFEFTEPSAEVDVSFGTNPDGSTRWLELLGCGMVDPDVLTWCGLDPREYQGFAFGIGVERAAMLRHGIADIRTFSEGDARFSQRF